MTDVLVHSYQWPATYPRVILYNCLKSNRHLTASCRLPMHKTFQIGIGPPFVCCLFSCYALKPSQTELASDCQLSVANSPGLTNLQPAVFDGCLFTYYSLKLPQIELAFTAIYKLPIHKNLRFGIWLLFACCLFRCYALNPFQIKLTSDCQWPIHKKLQIGIWLPLAFF